MTRNHPDPGTTFAPRVHPLTPPGELRHRISLSRYYKLRDACGIYRQLCRPLLGDASPEADDELIIPLALAVHERAVRIRRINTAPFWWERPT